jgi:hypothetical protein
MGKRSVKAQALDRVWAEPLRARVEATYLGSRAGYAQPGWQVHELCAEELHLECAVTFPVPEEHQLLLLGPSRVQSLDRAGSRWALGVTVGVHFFEMVRRVFCRGDN